MLEKNGPKVTAASKAKRLLLSDPNAKAMSISSQVQAAAAPYEVIIQEDMATYDIKIALLDKRQDPIERIVVRIPRGAMSGDASSHATTIMRAVDAAKKRLQKRLAERCDEPEIRLWAAENRDVDLMDNSEIPSRIRGAYDKHLAVEAEKERLERQELSRSVPKATERPIESDSGPVYDTPPPVRRKIKRRPRVTITAKDEASSKLAKAAEEIASGESTENEVKPNVPVKTVKGAHAKTPMRKPVCKNRDHDDPPEMVFFPEDGLWRCPEDGCGMTARPKDESPVGQVLLGKGRLDFRVIFTHPGEKPSIVLLADNNVALDITEFVDMENFLKYSRARQRAQAASRDGDGQEIITVKLGKDAHGKDRDVTALLRFPEMRIYGCDNA